MKRCWRNPAANPALQREPSALLALLTEPCCGPGLTHTQQQRSQPHSTSALPQLEPTPALLKPNAKKDRLNGLKLTHFQSSQLHAAAFTIFHAVLLNVGGRSPFTTETFAFPFSQCLVFFFSASSVFYASEKLWLSHKGPNSEGDQISDFS